MQTALDRRCKTVSKQIPVAAILLATLRLWTSRFSSDLTRSIALFACPIFFLGCQHETPQPALPTPAEESTESFALSPQTARTELRFETSSALENQQVVYDNGKDGGAYSILESLGGGVAIVDFDRNGILDCFFPGGGKITRSTDTTPAEIQGLPSRLIRRGFQDESNDCSHNAWVDLSLSYSHGAAAHDFDNDGFEDILVTGYGDVSLWLNKGDGTFENVATVAGLNSIERPVRWSTSAAWGDLNNDGSPDLYLANYVDWSFEKDPSCGSPVRDVCPPRRFEGLADEIYMNRGDGTFEDARLKAGLRDGGKGLGVVMADLDDDRDLDIYVANDTVQNFFYVNDGAAKFEEQAVLSGLAMDDYANANGSMGVAVSDFDVDGRPDIWVTNFEEEITALYHNDGGGNFSFDSRKAGLNMLGRLFVGFGCVTGDFDLDSFPDVAIANGHVLYHGKNSNIAQLPLVLLNRNFRFERAPGAIGEYFATRHLGRGLAVGDMDRNGCPDLIYVNTLEPASLQLNETPSQALNFTIRTIGTTSTRTPTGTVAVLRYGDETRTEQLVGGMGYLSTSSPELHFSVPAEANLSSLEIRWPNGEVTTLAGNEMEETIKRGRSSTLTIVEGAEGF